MKFNENQKNLLMGILSDLLDSDISLARLTLFKSIIKQRKNFIDTINGLNDYEKQQIKDTYIELDKLFDELDKSIVDSNGNIIEQKPIEEKQIIEEKQKEQTQISNFKHTNQDLKEKKQSSMVYPKCSDRIKKKEYIYMVKTILNGSKLTLKEVQSKLESNFNVKKELNTLSVSIAQYMKEDKNIKSVKKGTTYYYRYENNKDYTKQMLQSIN